MNTLSFLKRGSHFIMPACSFYLTLVCPFNSIYNKILIFVFLKYKKVHLIFTAFDAIDEFIRINFYFNFILLVMKSLVKCYSDTEWTTELQMHRMVFSCQKISAGQLTLTTEIKFWWKNAIAQNRPNFSYWSKHILYVNIFISRVRFGLIV